jgi:RNA polymerase sigma factor (sigma-70 family)
VGPPHDDLLSTAVTNAASVVLYSVKDAREAANVLMTQNPVLEKADSAVALTYEDVFRLNYPRVHALLFRVTGNAEDAADLAQEVFLQLYRHVPPIWRDPSAEAWLWRAASHAALNALRGNRRRRAREEQVFFRELPIRLVSEQSEDPAESLVRVAQQEAVREALRRLKPQESSLLLLRHAGLSYGAVAEALGINPTSVGTLLRRAEARFKERYHG